MTKTSKTTATKTNAKGKSATKGKASKETQAAERLTKLVTRVASRDDTILTLRRTINGFRTRIAKNRDTQTELAAQIKELTAEKRAETKRANAAEKQAAKLQRRSKKNPSPVDKARNAYMFFMGAERPKVLAEAEAAGEPKPPVPKVGKIVGARWRELSKDPDACAQYHEMAAADKERYTKELAAYKAEEARKAEAEAEAEASMEVDDAE